MAIVYKQAKTLLSSFPEGKDEWFGIRYNLNLYRGCQHQCIYCDSRSKCYQIQNFKDIEVKENAIQLLNNELKRKRKKGTIGFGSMNDPYMPLENELKLSRQALDVIQKHRFPVHLITKNKLVCRDIDLLKKISKIYAAVSFSISSSDPEVSKITEPGASTVNERFEAMRILAGHGIYTGIVLCPVLPFISDTSENILSTIRKAKEYGANYIIAWMGMTLREGSREYYYEKLDTHFPGIKEKYIHTYGTKYQCPSIQAERLHQTFEEFCGQSNLPTKMNFYIENKPEQLSLF